MRPRIEAGERTNHEDAREMSVITPICSSTALETLDICATALETLDVCATALEKLDISAVGIEMSLWTTRGTAEVVDISIACRLNWHFLYSQFDLLFGSYLLLIVCDYFCAHIKHKRREISRTRGSFEFVLRAAGSRQTGRVTTSTPDCFEQPNDVPIAAGGSCCAGSGQHSRLF